MQGLSLTKSIEIKKDKAYYLDRLERLFFTPRDEMYGFLDEGSEIPYFIWEDATPETVSRIVFEVKRLVSTYEPNLSLQTVIAGFVPLTTGELLLLIELEFYTVENPVELQKLNIAKLREE